MADATEDVVSMIKQKFTLELDPSSWKRAYKTIRDYQYHSGLGAIKGVSTSQFMIIP